jgi:hypothetical protein
MSKATEALGALLEGLPQPRPPSLSFPQRCAAYYALRRRFPQTIVAQAFNVTQGAVSALARCSVTGKYRKVAEEYRDLGHDAFGEKYFTDDHLVLIQKYRLKLLTDRPREQPSTFKLEGEPGEMVVIRLAWRPAGDIDPDTDQPQPAGWSWGRADAASPREGRYPTKTQAHNAALRAFGYEVRKVGRPRK